MINYILSKIFNNMFARVSTRASGPLLRMLGKPDLASNCIFVDLSDASTHLGDRLFFLPLISAFTGAGCRVKLSKQDRWTNDLLVTILGLERLELSEAGPSDLIVFPQPSLLNFRNLYADAILVDFSDAGAQQKISQQLLASFRDLLDMNFPDAPSGSIVLASRRHSDFLADNGRYFLFSNYINSGRFRKFFVDERKLLRQCEKLKGDGYRIVHLGSVADKLADKRVYPFVDLDLRGKIQISDMPSLVSSPAVLGAVTYDNFLMHLTGLYRKKAFVLFRGRLSKKNVDHHMQFVNNTFFDEENFLEYL